MNNFANNNNFTENALEKSVSLTVVVMEGATNRKKKHPNPEPLTSKQVHDLPKFAIPEGVLSRAPTVSSSSEDEESNVPLIQRRKKATPKRTKQTKVDREILEEIENPIPSTSGALRREVERMKKAVSTGVSTESPDSSRSNRYVSQRTSRPPPKQRIDRKATKKDVNKRSIGEAAKNKTVIKRANERVRFSPRLHPSHQSLLL
jgi:hypothetical protein